MQTCALMPYRNKLQMIHKAYALIFIKTEPPSEEGGSVCYAAGDAADQIFLRRRSFEISMTGRGARTSPSAAR